MRNCNFLRVVCGAILLSSFVAWSTGAQTTYAKLAGEFSITGPIVGDQVGSHIGVKSTGGWLVWQDNATDGSGLGISARRLNSSLSGEFGAFRVNQIGAGDQENPKVSLLNNGSSAFVWQAGRMGFQDIFLRIIDANGLFLTGDIQVNVYTNQHQSTPSIACLANGNLFIVWSSFGQDGSMQGVYGRIYSPSGNPLGAEFQVNQTTLLNQRNPQVSALSDGRAIVTWVSERRSNSSEVNALQHVAEIVGRVFGSNGVPLDEFVISDSQAISAHPAVAAISSGGFMVGWSQLNSANNSTNGWDVYVRSFDSDLQPQGNAVRVNDYLVGDQFGPEIAVNGPDAFVVWTSLAQDGSNEGVYARNLTVAGQIDGPEIRVNSTIIHSQTQPSVASDGLGRFLVVWSGFIGGFSSFDLFAQRYTSGDPLNSLYAPDAPFVTALSSAELSVTWPELAGYPVAFYELYVGSDESPVIVDGIFATISNLLPGSTNSIRLLYQLTDGRRSPLSSPASGVTWGADDNGDGLPDDWQVSIWGADPANWPAPHLDSDGDGASNFAEFLAGTNPADSASVLKTRLLRSGQGFQFSWTSKPGFVYQVQRASSLNVWENMGAPRFAHGNFDSISVAPAAGSIFYRIIRLR